MHEVLTGLLGKKDWTNHLWKLNQAPDYVLSTASHKPSLSSRSTYWLCPAIRINFTLPITDAYVLYNNVNLICWLTYAEVVLDLIRGAVKSIPCENEQNCSTCSYVHVSALFFSFYVKMNKVPHKDREVQKDRQAGDRDTHTKILDNMRYVSSKMVCSLWLADNPGAWQTRSETTMGGRRLGREAAF